MVQMLVLAGVLFSAIVSSSRADNASVFFEKALRAFHEGRYGAASQSLEEAATTMLHDGDGLPASEQKAVGEAVADVRQLSQNISRGRIPSGGYFDDVVNKARNVAEGETVTGGAREYQSDSGVPPRNDTQGAGSVGGKNPRGR